MAGEWRTMPADEAATINPTVSLPRDGAHPFVAMGQLDSAYRWCYPSEQRPNGGGARFRGGDTLLARITPCLENGRIARYYGSPEEVAFGSTEFIVFRGRHRTTTDDFINYLVRSPDFRAFAVSQMTGSSGRQRVPVDCFANLMVDVPPLDEQTAICGLLGSLDDKIELNRRMAATLEEMARALFKSWFVDFDPVRAKAEGRDPGLPAATAALFPATFSDDDIPAGWRLGSVADIVEVNPSLSLKAGTTAPYVDMAALPTTGSCISGYIMRDASSGSRFQLGDTLVARITPCLENGKTALVDFLDDGQVGWGSTEFIVLRPRAPMSSVWPYLLARDDAFRTHLIAAMTGSSGRQRVPPSAVAAWEMALPPPAILSAFAAEVDPLFERISALDLEAGTLRALRDTLLPKLISGELRIKDMGKDMEAA